MSHIQSTAISLALLACGALGIAWSAKPLWHQRGELPPPNVLGINRSPYGEVFSMAMQSPIDLYWHGGAEDEHHDEHGATEAEAPRPSGWRNTLIASIESMHEALLKRTNLKGSSAAHQRFIRRGTEDKLRFAYKLDPGHYGNYNSYHFFITEPELGTRPQLSRQAADLARETYDYCMARRDDPRYALTAASAAGNVLELMFNDRHINPHAPTYSTAQMRELLALMDRAIGLHAEISSQWDRHNLWQRLSAYRLEEIAERRDFVLKTRDAHEGTLRRLEGLPPTTLGNLPPAVGNEGNEAITR